MKKDFEKKMKDYQEVMNMIEKILVLRVIEVFKEAKMGKINRKTAKDIIKRVALNLSSKELN